LEIPDHFDLSEARLLERRHALGIDAADRARLRARLAEVRPYWPVFLDRLYQRLGAHAPTATLLQTRPDTVQRLMRAQTRYLDALFGADLDEAHARFLIQLGLVHYRLGVTPQWYVATYAHFICDHLDALGTAGGSAADTHADLTSLIRSVFYDLGFVLDAYGVGEVSDLRQRNAQVYAQSAAGAASIPGGGAPSSDATRSMPPSDLAQVRLTDDDVQERSRFLAIEPDDIAALRELKPDVATATPAILEEFYQFFSAHPETAALVPEGVVGRLKRQVASYWAELVGSDFSRPYAASRMRVGLMHERIGLSLQWYFGGIARQLIGFLAAPGLRAQPARQRALIKAVFFDLTHVIDAYMEARADALLRGADRAAALIASLDAAVAIIDSQQRVVAANRAMVDLFPGDAGMLYRMPITQALPIDVVRETFGRLLAGDAPRAVAFGALGARQLKVTAFRLATSSGTPDGEYGIVLDEITDLLRATRDGSQHRDRLLDVIATSDAVLWEMDASDRTVTVISSSVLALAGFRDVHFVGRPDAWLECVATLDQPRLRAFLDASCTQSCRSIDYRLVRADGSECWVRSQVSRVTGDDGACLLRAVTVSIDAERRADAARMQSLGSVAGGVAHLLNNSLMVMSGSLELLARTARDSASRTTLADALVEIKRAQGVTRSMLAFAGRQALLPVRIALQTRVRNTIDATSATSTLPIDLDAPDGDALWPVTVDPGQLDAVLWGLIANATEAMAPSGRIVVRLRNVDGSTLPPTDVGVGSDWVEIAVIDTGHGMSPEVRRRAIEPFFTTRAETDGHQGLGLSLAHGFAVQSGGYLLIESREGQGTAVRLRLPRPEVTVTESAPRAVVAPRVVLVVEDHAGVRRVLVDLLAGLGYQAFAAASAAEALELVQSTAFDILLSDIRLGRGMDGVELAQWFTRHHPLTGVVLMSGYSAAQLDLRNLPARCRFIAKPFTPELLLQELEAAVTVVDSSASSAAPEATP